MAPKVNTTQKKVTALQQEAATLTKEIEALEEIYRRSVASLDKAYATAERTGSEKAVTTASDAERDSQGLEAKLRRKKAALAACKADLSVARQEHERAVWAAAMEQELSIVEELDKLAADLQANCLQPEKWLRVTELTTQGNRLYINRLRTEGGRSVFADGSQARNHFFTNVKAAMNDGHMRFQSIAEILGLDQTRRRLGGIPQM